MATATAERKKKKRSAANDLQLTTFYVGPLLMAVNISQVKEINRQLDTTPVAHAPEFVRGVLNLRGEVVTVIDMRSLLGLPPAEVTHDSRNLIVLSQGETIGLLVDRVSDIMKIPHDEIDPAPPNVAGVDSKFFQGVHTLESEILVILNVEEALNRS